MTKPYVLLSMVVSGALIMAQSSAQEVSKADTDNPQNVFRSEVKLVSVYFTVRDSKKQLASTLEQNQFRVYEDGKEQSIKFFAHHTDVVLNVGMLLDTGTSMAWMLNEEAQASSLFLKHVVRPKDLGFVLSYANRVETLQLPTSDTALLEEKVNSIKSGATIVGTPDQTPPPLPGGPGMPGPVPSTGPIGQPNNRNNREAHMYDAIRVGTVRYLEHEV